MRSSEPLSRHQILLFKGDMERLDAIYTVRSPTSVIRALVRKHIEECEARRPDLFAPQETDDA